MDKNLKAINFDIKQNLLDIYYPKSNSNAYYEIEKFMLKNGFEHNQGSGYLSKDKLTIEDIYKFLKEMNYELPWTVICIDKIEITERVMQIQNDSFINNKLKYIEVFTEILYNRYEATPDLVQQMIAYKNLKGEMPNLKELDSLLKDEENAVIKNILSEIKAECEHQDFKRYSEILKSIEPEESIELDEDLEI